MLLLALAGTASAAPASPRGSATPTVAPALPAGRATVPVVDPAGRQQSRVAPAAPALPSEVALFIGESVTVPVGGGTTFSQSDVRVASVTQEAGGLRIDGLAMGRSLVYVIMPRGVHVLRVTVQRRRRVQQVKAPEVLWEEQARISTGGLLKRGSLWAMYTRDARGHALPLRLGLQGGRGPVRYDILSTYQPNSTDDSLLPTLSTSETTPTKFMHTLRLDVGPAELKLGSLLLDQPFDTAALVTGFTREARLSAAVGRTSALLSVRGTATAPGLVAPERMAMRVGQRFGDVGVSVGSFVSPTGTADVVPFVDVTYDPTRTLHAALSYGTTRGLSATPRDLVGGTVSATMGDCRLMGGYATYLGTRALADTAYEPSVPHQFLARGDCRIEQVSAGITAMRMPSAARSFGEIARVATQVNAPVGPLRLGLGAQYWANEDASRRAVLGTATAVWTFASDSQLSAAVNATRRGGTLWLSETLRAERRKGFLQGNAALAATHSGGRPPSMNGTLGAAIEPTKSLVVGANVGTGYDFATTRALPVFTRANVQWTPVPNYTFQTWFDHQLLSDVYRLQAGVQYAFGDDLPREPLLYPFRADALVVEAFEDLDRDGVRDENEPLLSGVPACVDMTCGVTGPDGLYRVEDLTEGLHEASIDTSKVAGATPTNESRRKVGVGRYREERLSVGVRYRGLFKIRTYVDQNHNGRRDPDETETLPGLGVKLTAPGITTTVVPPGGESELEWTQEGPWEARIDGFSLPAGYVANGGSTAKGVLKQWDTAVIEVGVSVLRSIAGSVCVDANANDKCEPEEERVGLVHVDADGQQGVANTEGKYFVPFMPSGTWTVKIPEIEVPGGLVQKFVPTVTFGAIPRAETDVAVPLRRQTQVKRPSTYVVTWPKVGSAEAAELGGHFMDGAPLRAAKGKEGAPSRDDAKVLKQLAGLAKRPNTKIFLTVNMDPQLPPDEAEADAHDLARTLGRWFVKTHKMKPADVVTEVAMPAGRTPRVSVRVYQLRSRGR